MAHQCATCGVKQATLALLTCSASCLGAASVSLGEALVCHPPRDLTEDVVRELYSDPDVSGAQLIGMGAQGSVYWHDRFPEWAVKATTDVTAVTREFTLQCDFHEQLDKWNLDALRYVRLVRAPMLLTDDGLMVMQRIVRPTGAPGDAARQQAVQAYVGQITNADMGDRGKRGYYVSRATTLGLLGIGDDAMQQDVLDEELGRLLGTIHYRVGNDFSDVEFLVGSTAHDPTVRLRVVDFGLCLGVPLDKAEAVDRLAAPLIAEPHYPIDRGEVFKSAYLQVATAAGHADLARRVLDEAM